MSQTFAPEKTAPAGKLHLGWLMLPGLMLALAQTSFIDRSWQDCEVTRQIDVTSTQLFALGIPALTLLNAALIALPVLAYSMRRQAPAMRIFLTIGSAVMLLVALCFLLVVYVAAPPGTTDMACSGGFPTWWPGWLAN